MSLKEKIQNSIYLGRYKNRNAHPSCFAKIKAFFIRLALFGLLLLVISTQFQGVLNLLRAPNLPEIQTMGAKGKPLPQYWTNQNWGGTTDKPSDKTRRYHYTSQGTATIPMPYDWFLALEKPDDSLVYTLLKSLFFVDSELFSDNNYLLRFGFIRGEVDKTLNPDGLPIGLTKTDALIIPGMPIRADGIGFTCAACHTGHFIAGQGDSAKEYIIEGGPATTDLGQLTVAITATLGQTGLSSKIPFFDGRFDRFAKRLLGTQYNATNKALLSTQLANLISNAEKLADVVKVQEGYGRLDAVNRIGNQVFSKNINRPENYQPIDAPVNYPFIWTSSWFKWVQYDGSIMGPLIRNVGESVGVSAYVNMDVPEHQGRYQSSVPVVNIVWMERFLKGKAFNEGLTAPVWPFEQVDHNSENYKLGEALYQQRCLGCHLPVVGSSALNKKLQPITYFENGKKRHTAEKVLDLKIIKQSDIGTDPAQGNILATRLLNAAGNAQGTTTNETNGLGLDTMLCAEDHNQVIKNNLYEEAGKPNLINDVKITDGGNMSFAFALGAFVDQTINAWFDVNLITDEALKEKMRGGRPNCLQAGKGYKARTLNGVWSTAPFLHNGSVATIKDLICKPEQERPQYVQLGELHFDTKNLGLIQPKDFEKRAKRYLAKGEVYTKDGYFILDTSISGNSNQGHSFSDQYDPDKKYYDQIKGAIGPRFNEKECSAILDYIKTI
jgi:hypothetical protein